MDNKIILDKCQEIVFIKKDVFFNEEKRRKKYRKGELWDSTKVYNTIEGAEYGIAEHSKA